MTNAFCGIDIMRQDHIDGAICILPILGELYKLSGLELPKEVREYRDMAEFVANLKQWYRNPQIDIQKKFSLVTNVMQNKDTLFLVCENHVRVRREQGICYVDATFAPEYSVRGDKKSTAKLTVKEAIEAMIEGIKSGERKYPDIEVNLICAVDRANTSERAVELVDIFSECNRNYVRAIDLVCDEVRDGPEKHIAMFKRAGEYGFKKACHAAEFVKHRPDEEKETVEQVAKNFAEDLSKRLDNLRVALFDLKADFINHGLGLCFDPELVGFVASHRLGVSICPANYIDSRLIHDVEIIGIPEMLEEGVPVILDVDDDLMFDGLEKTVKMCNLSDEQVRKISQNARDTRFGNRKEHKF